MKRAIINISITLCVLGTLSVISNFIMLSSAGACPLTVPDDWRKCALCPQEIGC